MTEFHCPARLDMPQSLPNEVLSLLFHAVDFPDDLLSARAPCKAFDALASPLIFASLTVRIATAVQIADLIITGSALANHVKVVHFNVTDEDEALPFEDFEEHDQNESGTGLQPCHCGKRWQAYSLPPLVGKVTVPLR